MRKSYHYRGFEIPAYRFTWAKDLKDGHTIELKDGDLVITEFDSVDVVGGLAGLKRIHDAKDVNFIDVNGCGSCDNILEFMAYMPLSTFLRYYLEITQR